MAGTPLRDQRLPSGEPAYLEHAGSYARLRGKSRQTGKNWNDQGLIVWVRDDASPHDPSARLVDVAASDAARAALQNPLKRQAPAPGAQPDLIAPEHPRPESPPQSVTAADQEPAAGPADRPAAGSAQSASNPADPQLARVNVQKVEGQDLDNALKRVRLAKALGELVSLDERRAAETSRMRRLRDRLLALPTAIAEELNPANPATAQAILRREVRAVLEQLANELAADARRTYGADDDAADDSDDSASDESATASAPEMIDA